MNLQFRNMRRTVRVDVRAGESYDISIGRGALDALGDAARRVAGRARRVALISNRRVFDLYGERAAKSLKRRARLSVSHWLMGEGERCKTLRTAERALRFLAEAGIERSDVVVALGGGVVGDLAGFASALHLRGVAFIQAPTTLLAQIDSSVGGKTGVNTVAGKNLVGVFHHPNAVLADTDALATLPARELTAGWCEAIKQGAAGDRDLFERTYAFLSEKRRACEERRGGGGRGKRVSNAVGEEGAREGYARLEDERRDGDERLADLIAAQCEFKARIVAGDEREDVARTDARSRRILNFGHTVGHALEAATGYRRFRHGEAVGLGMLVAGEISVRLEMLDASELEYLREAVRLAGSLPRADDVDEGLIRRAILKDKKSVGGNIRWVLLERLGRARIVEGGEVSARILRASLRSVLAAKI